MYFRSLIDEGPHSGAALFLQDGALILLLSCAHEDGAETAEALVAQMKEFAEADYGYWAWESPPECSAAEFMRTAGPKRG